MSLWNSIVQLWKGPAPASLPVAPAFDASAPDYVLDEIEHCEVIVHGDTTVSWTAPAMIDGDGTGGNPEHDPDFQRETTLRHADGTFLNSRTEKFIVVPKAVRNGVKGTVMGCQAWVKNNADPAAEWLEGVVGDEGPALKLGELSIAYAIALKIPSSPTTGGDSRPDISYRIQPDQPAVVNGITYPLQKA